MLLTASAARLCRLYRSRTSGSSLRLFCGASSGEVAVICGASRGIGLEMCRQLLAHSRIGTVFALGRTAETSTGLQALQADSANAGRLKMLNCDVADEQALSQCTNQIRDEVGSVDVVINSAGALSDLSGNIPLRDMPEKSLAKVSMRNLEFQFRINAFAPVLMAKAFVPLLKASKGRSGGQPAVFASLSARVGSIGDNQKGGWYSYRGAKAAQNALLRCVAMEMGSQPKNPIVLLLHPGTVDTELSVPFQRHINWEVFPVEKASTQLLDIILAAEKADNGRFYDWKKEEIPW